MVYLGWFYDFTLAARQHRTILEPETMCGLVKFVHALSTLFCLLNYVLQTLFPDPVELNYSTNT